MNIKEIPGNHKWIFLKDSLGYYYRCNLCDSFVAFGHHCFKQQLGNSISNGIYTYRFHNVDELIKFKLLTCNELIIKKLLE